jgi:hypothetical protein
MRRCANEKAGKNRYRCYCCFTLLLFIKSIALKKQVKTGTISIPFLVFPLLFTPSSKKAGENRYCLSKYSPNQLNKPNQPSRHLFFAPKKTISWGDKVRLKLNIPHSINPQINQSLNK